MGTFLVATIVVAGCVGAFPGPQFPFLESATASSKATCTAIAGTYANWSPRADNCSGQDFLACRSLTFHLLSKHVPQAEGRSNKTTPTDDWPATAAYVVLEQPTDDSIRIFIHKSDADLAQLVGELRAGSGDFRCTSVGVELRPKADTEVLIAPTLYSGRSERVEYRLLRRSENGDLIVTSERRYRTYMLGVLKASDIAESRIFQWPAVTLPSIP